MKLEQIPDIDNLYWIQTGKKQQLATRNNTPGQTTYGEKLIHTNNTEVRIWNPRRSKLAAAIHKKTPLTIKKTDKILYLGASTGTTLSHISDINNQGINYAIEISPTSLHKLLNLAEKRKNIIPIFDDANKPNNYQHIVDQVNIIYQDIAQRNQADIAIKNTQKYLKPKGQLILTIKARSIDTTKNPETTLKKEIQTLQENNLTITHTTNLKPYHKDHYLITAQKTK